MPWFLASAQVILPLLLSSYRARASTSPAGADVGVGGAAEPGLSTTISVEAASVQDLVNSPGFGGVYGEAVLAAHFDYAVHVPALVPRLGAIRLGRWPPSGDGSRLGRPG